MFFYFTLDGSQFTIYVAVWLIGELERNANLSAQLSCSWIWSLAWLKDVVLHFFLDTPYILYIITLITEYWMCLGIWWYFYMEGNMMSGWGQCVSMRTLCQDENNMSVWIQYVGIRTIYQDEDNMSGWEQNVRMRTRISKTIKDRIK